MADTPTTRRPGGQPGNTNSLKHGFYARKLPRRDRTDWKNHTFNGVQEETQMLRFVIRRVFELSQTSTELEQSLSLLRILSLSLVSLTRLLRTDQLLASADAPLNDALDTAISEVYEEIRNNPTTTS